MQKIHRATSDYRKLMAMRAEIEATLQRMIGLLDDIDARSEDLEDTGDDEPCLGAPEVMPIGGGFNQTVWMRGADDDREWDEAEQSGIGDRDGLNEQWGIRA